MKITWNIVYKLMASLLNEWLLKLPDSENYFQHSSQVFGFSPVWVQVRFKIVWFWQWLGTFFTSKCLLAWMSSYVEFKFVWFWIWPGTVEVQAGLGAFFKSLVDVTVGFDMKKTHKVRQLYFNFEYKVIILKRISCKLCPKPFRQIKG